RRDEALFVLHADNDARLLEEIASLREVVFQMSGVAVDDIARRWWKSRKNTAAGVATIALVAQNSAQLQGLLESAIQRIRAGTDPVTPEPGGNRDRDRLFYVPVAKRTKGGVAFVFPGAGNAFPEMGRELALLWPGVLRAQDAQNRTLASQMCVDDFWNASSTLSPGTDHRAVICGQVSFGTFASDLAAQFGLKPEAVIGYSLGESTVLFALRAWTSRDEMLKRVSASSLFSRD